MSLNVAIRKSTSPADYLFFLSIENWKEFSILHRRTSLFSSEDTNFFCLIKNFLWVRHVIILLTDYAWISWSLHQLIGLVPSIFKRDGWQAWTYDGNSYSWLSWYVVGLCSDYLNSEFLSLRIASTLIIVLWSCFESSWNRWSPCSRSSRRYESESSARWSNRNRSLIAIQVNRILVCLYSRLAKAFNQQHRI